MRCPCGGETYVDSFDWPNKPRIWFRRCEKCDRMSESAATEEAAAPLEIKTDPPAGAHLLERE